ncbi:MAG: hypothetical protein U9R49_05050 [Bacteroidota bacterium]|nr:hypothetical protein [Bacteroidota bacterium]
MAPLRPNSDSGILLKGVGQANLWCWSVGSGELWSGRIGLQHHGGVNPETGKLRGASSLVQFRNIWIYEL